MRSDLLASGKRSRRRRRMLAFAIVSALGAIFVAVVPHWMAAGAGVDSAPVALRSPGPSRPSAARAPDESSRTAPPAPESLRTRPVSAWLGDIAREAGRDLVLSPDLRGDLTASESTRLDWHQRLDAYSRVFGFDFRLGDGLLEAWRSEGDASAAPRAQRGDDEVASREPVGGADVATNRRSAGGDHVETMRAQAPVAAPVPLVVDAAALAKAQARTRVVHLVHTSAKDAAAALSKTGEAVGVTVAADASSNALLLSGAPGGLGRILDAVGELDRPRRRILLEAKIVEVTRSARLDLGVEWKLTGTVGSDVRFPPIVSDAGSAALVVATSGASALDARISALEAGGRLRVVSRPSVVMLEGSPATIESVRILRIRLPSTGTVVGGEVVEAPSSGRATEDIPVGVRLEVTPAIRGGSRVALRIKAKSSSLGPPLPPDDIPEELSRMVDAEILVGDGETAVLGGLTREAGDHSGAGVPLIRRIPILGLLFGKTSKVHEEEELLVLVTPRLLDGG